MTRRAGKLTRGAVKRLGAGVSISEAGITATRLADLVRPVPGLPELTKAILVELRHTVDAMATGNFAAVQPRVNACWGGTPRVSVELDTETRQGIFTGVDELGRLRLQADSGPVTVLAPHQVKLLREL